jgi:Zn-dependent protease
MLPTRQGSFKLFRALGIDVHLHWTWLIVAFWGVSARQGVYTSPVWNVVEYLSLFGIVLLHEYGHSLACRSVGGRADQIVLWPLGGVAYVQPPFRPGAELWSIAAGPLVNVILVPVIYGVAWVLPALGVTGLSPDFWSWLNTLFYINFVILIFNLLPVYPLDGGQILRSLLWFGMGPRRSLLVATSIGLVGTAGFLLLAWYWQSIWIAVLAVFIGMTCWRSFQAARAVE